MKLIEKVKEVLHIHRYFKPIISQYVGFETRNIVYMCKCGKCKIREIYRSYENNKEFPIMTTYHITNEEIQEVLSGSPNKVLKNNSEDIKYLMEYSFRPFPLVLIGFGMFRNKKASSFEIKYQYGKIIWVEDDGYCELVDLDNNELPDVNLNCIKTY